MAESQGWLQKPGTGPTASTAGRRWGVGATWDAFRTARRLDQGVLTLQDLREPFLAFQAACSGQPCQGSRGHGSSKPVPASPVRVLPECCCPHCPGSRGNQRAPRVATGVMWVQSGATPIGHRRPAAALPGTLPLPQTPQLPAQSLYAPTRLRPTPASGGLRLPLSGAADVREAQAPSISISTILPGAAEAGDTCVPR